LRQSVPRKKRAQPIDDVLALTIAIAYGGHDEITDAVRALLREAANEGKALAEAIEAVIPAPIGRHLYMADLADPGLIIRTSGENRPSGFLLWQSAYSELYFYRRQLARVS
jgi:short-chain Z-isoprenyl diphosphate synthase